jgi:arylsulfatase A-like enzyme
MPAKPDIVWVIATQWRAQACGYAGDANARTPALDALAADAATINYAQAVTPHPFGPFARAALLTGMPSPENGVCDYFDALPTAARTIAHRMTERGYATAFFGKWGVGERDRAAPLVGEASARQAVPLHARGGFAHWEGFEGGFQFNDPWWQGPGEGPARQLKGYQSDVVCARAAEWWSTGSSATGGPRFALVSLEAPHPPYAADVPAGIVRPAPESLALAANVPCGGEVEAQARRELAGYYAHIEATDRAFGVFLAALDAAAARAGRPRPLVVFTSVHGDMHGAHGLFRKGWPHEESIRVPLLVRGAPRAGSASGGGAKGVRCDDAVSLLDLPAMTEAGSEGREWRCPRERTLISMPSVVALPLQCDRVWSGWRSANEKRVYLANGTEWVLPCVV